MNPINVPLTVSDDQMVIPMAVCSNEEQIALGIGYVIVSGMPEHYAGPYEITPGDEAQTISIRGMLADANIVVDPVPSNYGRITWNGSVLTVS